MAFSEYMNFTTIQWTRTPAKIYMKTQEVFWEKYYCSFKKDFNLPMQCTGNLGYKIAS